MNNLHRALAPISDEAWADLEAETRRTFIRNVAARRVVDVIGPSGETLAAVNTGHVRSLDSPGHGVRAQVREVQPAVELRVPFVVDREVVDSVARGAKDADWQPAKEAARSIAFAEDDAVFAGFAAAGIGGIRAGCTNPPSSLPDDPREWPNAVAKALTTLRLAGVAGPYSLVLSPLGYTSVAETADHGYPIREHIQRVLGPDGDIIWAPAITDGFLLSTRGGDYELNLGEDLSIGYQSHDADSIELYLQETLTFRVLTGEAGVALTMTTSSDPES
jgi:uncharacterized linocin/CFP29 family protein